MSSWKESYPKTLWVMDSILFIGFLLVCAPQATGIVLHEWLSLLFIVPFAIHLMLHWDWIVKTVRGVFSKMSASNRFNLIWDLALYLVMLLAILSGFLVSEALLPQLGYPIDITDFWSKVHHDFSTLLMPMLGIHIAMHWSWIKRLTKNMLGRNKAGQGEEPKQAVEGQ